MGTKSERCGKKGKQKVKAETSALLYLKTII